MRVTLLVCLLIPVYVAAASPPAAVENLTVTRAGGSMLVRFETASGAGELGFRVYRERNGTRTEVGSFVSGSALFAGAGTSIEAGRQMSARDSSGDAQSVYWVEAISTGGESEWFGPALPAPADTPETKSGAAVRSAGAISQGAAAAAVPFEKAASPGATQFALASAISAKIGVREDGWYHIAFADLAAAGFRAGDPSNLQLYCQGQEVPIRVTADGIGFLGRAADTAYTAENIYWLVPANAAGQRLAASDTQAGGRGARSFLSVIPYTDRPTYIPSARNGSTDKYFGPVILSRPVELPLTLPDPDPNPPDDAVVGLTLQGTSNGRHAVVVQVNGAEIGVAQFADQASYSQRFRFAQNLLHAGRNTITLVSRGSQDISAVARLAVGYWRLYRASQNTLQFTADAGSQVTVSGFTNSSIRAFDITEPGRVTELQAAVSPDGRLDRSLGNSRRTTGSDSGEAGGGYSAQLNVAGSGQRTILALTRDAMRSPSSLAINRPSQWHNGTGAQMLIVSHPDFLNALEPLKQWREQQGISTAVVDVTDLYDEFSFGLNSAQAIRDFVAASQGARYLLLVGDASADPRNQTGAGAVDFVPTGLVETGYMQTASDDWLADVNGDGVAELAVGRLPVRTASETAAVVEKLIRYDMADQSGDWARQAVMVSDVNNDYDFEGFAKRMEQELPSSLRVEEIFVAQSNGSAARKSLIDSLSRGAVFVNYFGHGSEDRWSETGLLRGKDITGLANGDRLPFVVALTCLNGAFDSPQTETLAEILLKNGRGGAIAVWASSGLTTPEWQLRANRTLIDYLFQTAGGTLGEGVRQAKAQISDPDVQSTWIFFGDPSTRLRTGLNVSGGQSK